MGIPVVIVPAGGLPVTEATNGYGISMTEATNGFGVPVTFVAAGAGGGSLAVTGIVSGPSIQLSASSVVEDAALATVVGALSVINGTGTYTFTLTNSAGGKFVLGGTNNSSLRTAAAFDYETASAHVIAVSATNGVTPIAAKNFTISVTDVAVLVPLAPVLVWTSASDDNMPNFTVDLPSGFGDYRDAADGDVIYLEITDNVAFTTTSTDTLDAGEVSGDVVAMEQATPLADTTYYARARLKRGADYSSYSNVEVKAIITDTPETTAFLARTTGLDVTHTNAYKALINGLVADGVFAKVDAMWVLATQDAATAVLNLKNTSFTLAPTNSPTFTADQGYQGNGTNQSISTGFIPVSSGTTFSQNSACISVYIRNNRTTTGAQNIIGVASTSGTVNFYISPLQTGNFNWSLNGTTFPTAANTSTQGYWKVSRTASNVTTVYKNGAAFTTNSGNSGVLTPMTNTIRLLSNTTSVNAPTAFSADQLAAAHIGGGLSTTEMTALSDRINAYMTAVGANVY